MIRTLILVGLGGMLGSMLRYGVSYIYLSRGTSSLFPVPTFIANLVGSLLIGILFATLSKHHKDFTIFLVTGFCGGFTTFSSFSMENISLIQRGEIKVAVLYTTLSLVLGLLLAASGYYSVKWLSS